jgi:hypothetical protein
MALAAEGIGEHLRAARGALGERFAGLLRSAVEAVEPARDFQVRSGQPDPLGANVVQVREDRGDGADLARRFGCPGGGVQAPEQKLVHSFVGVEDPDGGLGKRRLGFGRTAWHGCSSHYGTDVERRHRDAGLRPMGI